MKSNKRAMLFALESTYNDGTDPAVIDAYKLRDLSLTPMTGSDIERKAVRPYYGNSPKAPGEKFIELNIELEAAPSGTTGTAPKYNKVLQCCGLSEAIVADTSVTYAPVSDNEESGVFFVNMDGNLHKGRGARGTVSLSANAGELPVWKIKLVALVSTITADAIPAGIDVSGWLDSLVVNNTNTETLSFMGTECSFSKFSFDVAADVSQKNVVGNLGVEIVGRKPSGSVSIEDPGIGVKDFFTSHKEAAYGTCVLTHGKNAGEIIEITMPRISHEAPSYGDNSGTQMLDMKFTPEPISGNDEFTIVFK